MCINFLCKLSLRIEIYIIARVVAMELRTFNLEKKNWPMLDYATLPPTPLAYNK
jgi:hypothetical protein